jgi:fructose-1-phosphate kinase PfkB-like protein
LGNARGNGQIVDLNGQIMSTAHRFWFVFTLGNSQALHDIGAYDSLVAVYIKGYTLTPKALPAMLITANEQARAALGADAFAQEYAAGQTATLSEAIILAQNIVVQAVV